MSNAGHSLNDSKSLTAGFPGRDLTLRHSSNAESGDSLGTGFEFLSINQVQVGNGPILSIDYHRNRVPGFLCRFRS